MFILFLKKLATDTSAEEISRIKSILGQNNIRFEIWTTRGRTGSDHDSHVYLKSNPVIHNRVRNRYSFTLFTSNAKTSRAPGSWYFDDSG